MALRLQNCNPEKEDTGYLSNISIHLKKWTMPRLAALFLCFIAHFVSPTSMTVFSTLTFITVERHIQESRGSAHMALSEQAALFQKFTHRHSFFQFLAHSSSRSSPHSFIATHVSRGYSDFCFRAPGPVGFTGPPNDEEKLQWQS
jgi:hypothetical protein